MDSIEQLKGTLIVSCQAEEGFPLNTPDHLVAMAQSAVMGGASAIRASGPENTRAMRRVLEVPLIGIYKKDYPGYDVRITPTLKEVEAIVEAGSDMVAVDATHRPRPDGRSFADLYHIIRERFDVLIMGDVSTYEEGVAAARLGVDVVSTTLSGYTDYSPQRSGPDIELVRQLASDIDKPVIAEGRITAPEDVRAALSAGAFAVVVGSMITRPHLITQHFRSGLKLADIEHPVLALDIGGTKIAGGVIGSQGAILHAVRVPTPPEGAQAILDASLAVLQDLREKAGPHQPAAIGISTGGQIDEAGNIVGATDMIANWQGFPLRERIREAAGLPVSVLNDGHAAALAEAVLGAGRSQESMLCVVIGTGLGGGLVVKNRLGHGAYGLAGSVGQLKVTQDGRNYLPLERLVSGPGLAMLYNDRQPDASQHVSAGVEVAEQAEAGDDTAAAAIKEMGWWLGLGLSHALHAYDTHCVVVGGSVAQLGEWLLDPARSSLAQHGHSTVSATPVVLAELGPNAGLIGAAVRAAQAL